MILPDGATRASRYWPSRLLSVALTRSQRAPSSLANTNCNDDFPSDRASNFAISPVEVAAGATDRVFDRFRTRGGISFGAKH